MSSSDTHYMQRALALAELGRYITRPNPSVGCVLVKDGLIVGEGHTQEVGYAHGERVALAQAGAKAAGATAYVTLEPCSHFGRTPPCADALIEAGIKRVVYAMEDPFDQVSGSGVARLRAAGIEVAGPLLEKAAYRMNAGFFRRITGGRAWVLVKTAASLDGAVAMASGESKWITGAEARRDVQKLRAQSCAIITSVDTVLADDAKLTLRKAELELPQGLRDRALKVAPLRVVLDTHGRLTGKEAIFSDDAPSLWVTSPSASVANDVSEHLTIECDSSGHLNLEQLVEVLTRRGCNQLMVEAGAKLATAFFTAKLVDEWVLYQAPVVLGEDTQPMLRVAYTQLAQAARFKIDSISQVGEDVRYRLLPRN